MSKQWQIRRGTAAQNDAFTGAEGEVTMDTTHKSIRLHDGSTAGGYTAAYMAMPGSTYDTLQWGASGTDYVAPADGYFVVGAASTSVGSWIYMGHKEPATGFAFTSHVGVSGANHEFFFPARKGQKVRLAYADVGTVSIFNFVYTSSASGSN